MEFVTAAWVGVFEDVSDLFPQCPCQWNGLRLLGPNTRNKGDTKSEMVSECTPIPLASCCEALWWTTGLRPRWRRSWVCRNTPSPTTRPSGPWPSGPRRWQTFWNVSPTVRSFSLNLQIQSVNQEAQHLSFLFSLLLCSETFPILILFKLSSKAHLKEDNL